MQNNKVMKKGANTGALVATGIFIAIVGVIAICCVDSIFGNMDEDPDQDQDQDPATGSGNGTKPPSSADELNFEDLNAAEISTG